MLNGIRHLLGAAILIVAIGLPSCLAFNEAVGQPPVATVPADSAPT